MKTSMDERASRQIRARYDRNARLYDTMEYMVEWAVFKGWRKRLWAQVSPGNGLEVGVGTGKNIPYYPAGAQITAIDLSTRMLERARRRAARLGAKVELMEMDAQELRFPDDTFDWALATFAFCSVPDPIRGLRELGRVVKPGGRILLLEHVRIDRLVIGRLMDLYNPLAVRLTGANINRQTVKNVEASGLLLEEVEDVAPLGLAKLITARVNGGRAETSS